MLNSRSGAAVAIVFSGPDLALEQPMRHYGYLARSTTLPFIRRVFPRIPEKQIRRRSRSRDEKASSRLRLRRRSWCLRYLEVPLGKGR